MRQRRVIVEISPSALEVAVCRGRTIAGHRRIVLDKAEWPSPWQSALDDLKPQLDECVSQLGCAGCPTTIIYSVPGSFVHVHSCPAAAGRAGAVQAARLALSSLVTFPLDSNPHGIRLLHADRPAANSDGTPVRLHAIGAADTDATVAALTHWAQSAGLCVASVTPAEAALTAAALECAMSSGAAQTGATLFIGTHQSVLAVVSGQRLELVRTIAAGTETLVEALLRPVRPRGDGTSITLDRSAARRLLAAVGIPGAQAPLPDLPGCDGACILPLLQPALQRLSVEIKQSLRFGLSESARSAVALRLAGEGSRIPNLADVLARQAGIVQPVHTAIPDNPSDSPSPSSDRLAIRAASLSESLVCLLGNEATRQMTVTGLRRALIAGIAAAAALLTVQGVSVFATLSKERERLAAIKSSAAGTDALAGVQDRALAARTATTALSRRIATTMGQSPDWAAVLAVIAERTPPSMRILDLGMSSTGTTPSCSLRAYVRIGDAVNAPNEIRRFVEALGKEPLVDSVRLGMTQRAKVRGGDAETFELAIGLVPVPIGENLALPASLPSFAQPEGSVFNSRGLAEGATP